MALLAQYKPDAGMIEAAKAMMRQSPPVDADNASLSSFYVERGSAASRVGDARQQLADYRKAREYARGKVETWWVLVRLSTSEGAIGNLRNAVDLRKEAIPLSGGFAGGGPIHDYAELISAYVVVGDIDAARQTLSDLEWSATGLLRKDPTGWFAKTYLSRLEQGRGLFAHAVGKYAQAEIHFRQAASALEQYIELTPRIPPSAGRPAPISAQKQRLEMLLVSLSHSQSAQGNFADAEITLREALKSALSERGVDHVVTRSIVIAMASLLNQTGRFGESEAILRNTAETLKSIGVAVDSETYLNSRSMLTDAYVGLGNWNQAIQNHLDALSGIVNDPIAAERFRIRNVSFAVALLRNGQGRRALELLEAQTLETRKWLGDEHYSAAELIGLQGIANAKVGDISKSLQAYRQSVPILVKGSLAQGDDTSILRSQRLKYVLESYMELLNRIRATPLEHAVGIDSTDEAFRLADLLRSQSTQAAVVASAVRAAANDPQIGSEIRKEQDLRQEVASLHRILRGLMDTPSDQQLPKVIADMKARIDVIKTERTSLQADIERQFPAYTNLVRPTPPSLAEARAVLRPGEALLNIFSAPGVTYVWAMQKDGPIAFQVVPLSLDQVTGMVRKLREALDPGDVDIERALPRFDLDTGFELYSQLLIPVAAGWQGATSLLVAANGALGQLPLAVLPTQKSALATRKGVPYTDYADIPWLIRQMAVTQLPSVNALVVLRKLPAGSAERTPFIGFGDPLFGKEQQIAAIGSRKLRNLSIARAEPSMAAAPVAETKPAATTTTPDWVDYSKIPPLPDTREEILSLAATLKADTTKDVFLGAEASKANVRKLDLSKRKIVAFATHGLLPNDFPGVAEPSLALANPNDGKHGLLTLEDILGLKLDADWVVLSACNTAAGDGTAADAVSGLGRGFFYAGTRALLVTHWPVESVSARLLVTGLFDRQAKDATLSRAQALRQSMLALMGQNSGSFAYAHPLFWAPYALVGDGGG
jgi:CHAT domain-containing protein